VCTYFNDKQQLRSSAIAQKQALGLKGGGKHKSAVNTVQATALSNKKTGKKRGTKQKKTKQIKKTKKTKKPKKGCSKRKGGKKHKNLTSLIF
jgi:hypothetical protein